MSRGGIEAQSVWERGGKKRRETEDGDRESEGRQVKDEEEDR
jgi:hypothetical protein